MKKQNNLWLQVKQLLPFKLYLYFDVLKYIISICYREEYELHES
jgi:hypothetical protein